METRIDTQLSSFSALNDTYRDKLSKDMGYTFKYLFPEPMTSFVKIQCELHDKLTSEEHAALKELIPEALFFSDNSKKVIEILNKVIAFHTKNAKKPEVLEKIHHLIVKETIPQLKTLAKSKDVREQVLRLKEIHRHLSQISYMVQRDLSKLLQEHFLALFSMMREFFKDKFFSASYDSIIIKLENFRNTLKIKIDELIAAPTFKEIYGVIKSEELLEYELVQHLEWLIDLYGSKKSLKTNDKDDFNFFLQTINELAWNVEPNKVKTFDKVIRNSHHYTGNDRKTAVSIKAEFIKQQTFLKKVSLEVLFLRKSNHPKNNKDNQNPLFGKGIKGKRNLKVIKYNQIGNDNSKTPLEIVEVNQSAVVNTSEAHKVGTYGKALLLLKRNVSNPEYATIKPTKEQLDAYRLELAKKEGTEMLDQGSTSQVYETQSMSVIPQGYNKPNSRIGRSTSSPHLPRFTVINGNVVQSSDQVVTPPTKQL